MKRTTGFLILILCTFQNFAQWVEIDRGTHQMLNDVKFVNTTTGWILSPNELLKTTDKGNNWVSQLTDSTYLRKVFFLDLDTGWIASDGGVYKTANSGNSWQLISPGAFYELFFINSQVGWGIRNNGGVSKTTDGGANWVKKSTPNYYRLNSIFFIDENKGWAVGEGGEIVHSNDGGETWVDGKPDINQTGKVKHHFKSVFFTDSLNGWIVGEYYGGSIGSTIGYTGDGGKTWSSLPDMVSFQSNLNSIHFSDAKHGWAAGKFYIYHSQDSGMSWVNQFKYENSLERISTIHCVDKDFCMAVGAGGIILRLDETTASNSTNDFENNYILTKVFPNPFSNSTTIEFNTHQKEQVRLEVYDIQGKKVATLIDKTLLPDVHQVDFNASLVKKGVYFYHLHVGDNSTSGKIILQ